MLHAPNLSSLAGYRDWYFSNVTGDGQGCLHEGRSTQLPTPPTARGGPNRQMQSWAADKPIYCSWASHEGWASTPPSPVLPRTAANSGPRKGVCNLPEKQQQPEELQLEILGRKKTRETRKQRTVSKSSYVQEDPGIKHGIKDLSSRYQKRYHTISSDTMSGKTKTSVPNPPVPTD